MRSVKAIFTAVMGMLNQLLRSILSLVTRKVFMMTLGASVLGLNSLFSSEISVLSLTELGIGTAIVICLYEPLAKKDTARICAFFKILKHFNAILMIIVSIGGIVLIPFMLKTVNGDYSSSFVIWAYILYLFGTVSSYYKSYYRNLLNADQNGYIVQTVDTIGCIILNIMQIIILYFFHLYYLYLLSTIIYNIIGNLILEKICKKRYEWLDDYKSELQDKDKQKFINIVRGMFIYRLAAYLIQSFDNIVISVLLGTVKVAYYGNYNLVVGMLNAILTSVMNATTAGFGNTLYTDKEQIYYRVKILTFIQHIMYSSTAGALLLLANDFVEFIFGQEAVCTKELVVAFTVFFYVRGISDSLEPIRASAGLYKDRYWQLMLSFLNLIVSIYCTYLWGLVGVVVGTVVCFVIKCYVLNPDQVFKEIISKKYKKEYVMNLIKYFLVFGCVVIICFSLPSLQSFSFGGRLVAKGFMGVGIGIIINYFAFFKDSVFLDSVDYINKLVSNIRIKICGR